MAELSDKSAKFLANAVIDAQLAEHKEMWNMSPPPGGHFKHVCRRCKEVKAQCRCAGEKTEHLIICADCQFRGLEQVAYVPSHVPLDCIWHDDVEWGFVSSDPMAGDSVFVRYWVKGAEGVRLRTRANSEATPVDRLVRQHCCSEEEVAPAWAEVQPDPQQEKLL